jgi:hypothetical protein
MSVCRCFGGDVSWDSTVAIGSTYPETDESITHQMVDRPTQGHRFLSRYRISCIGRIEGLGDWGEKGKGEEGLGRGGWSIQP